MKEITKKSVEFVVRFITEIVIEEDGYDNTITSHNKEVKFQAKKLINWEDVKSIEESFRQQNDAMVCMEDECLVSTYDGNDYIVSDSYNDVVEEYTAKQLILGL